MIPARSFLCAPLLIGALTAGCDKPAPVKDEVLRSVRVTTVRDAENARVRVFSGIAQSSAESKISFRVSGTLTKVPIQVGSQIKEGDLLAHLDASDYELQVQEAVAGRAQAVAQSRNAETTFGRTRDLYANRTASRQDMDQARAARDSGRAAVFAINKRIQLARKQVRYTKLVAPVAGVISAVLAEVNENVAAGQPIVVLSSNDAPEVRFGVPEVLVAQLNVGDAVSVQFDALANQSFEAAITEIGVTGARTGSTFPITARIKAPDKSVRPGMAAEVSCDFGGREDPGLRVPPFAVAEDKDGRFVFLLEADKGVVRRRPVEVGDLTEAGLAVTQGLTAGDQLVTAGVTRLIDGQKVRLMKAPGAAPRSGPRP